MENPGFYSTVLLGWRPEAEQEEEDPGPLSGQSDKLTHFFVRKTIITNIVDTFSLFWRPNLAKVHHTYVVLREALMPYVSAHGLTDPLPAIKPGEQPGGGSHLQRAIMYSVVGGQGGVINDQCLWSYISYNS